jgi:hypothetical protein
MGSTIIAHRIPTRAEPTIPANLTASSSRDATPTVNLRARELGRLRGCISRAAQFAAE